MFRISFQFFICSLLVSNVCSQYLVPLFGLCNNNEVCEGNALCKHHICLPVEDPIPIIVEYANKPPISKIYEVQASALPSFQQPSAFQYQQVGQKRPNYPTIAEIQAELRSRLQNQLEAQARTQAQVNALAFAQAQAETQAHMSSIEKAKNQAQGLTQPKAEPKFINHGNVDIASLPSKADMPKIQQTQPNIAPTALSQAQSQTLPAQIQNNAAQNQVLQQQALSQSRVVPSAQLSLPHSQQIPGLLPPSQTSQTSIQMQPSHSQVQSPQVQQHGNPSVNIHTPLQQLGIPGQIPPPMNLQTATTSEIYGAPSALAQMQVQLEAQARLLQNSQGLNKELTIQQPKTNYLFQTVSAPPLRVTSSSDMHARANIQLVTALPPSQNKSLVPSSALSDLSNKPTLCKPNCIGMASCLQGICQCQSGIVYSPYVGCNVGAGRPMAAVPIPPTQKYPQAIPGEKCSAVTECTGGSACVNGTCVCHPNLVQQGRVCVAKSDLGI